MKRKFQKRKPDYKTGRSTVAREAWERPGGIHKDQIRDPKQDRKSSKKQLREYYY
jgi:hypothetical protein